MSKLFLDRSNHRRLAEDYRGLVLIWDIDKTYLESRFSTARGLLGIILEAAVDKRAVPGAVPLIRGLRRGPGVSSALTPLYFISGSPPQLRGVIERKMVLDGVDFDGVTFKDQLGLMKRGRPRALREQVGYKLCALLLYRAELPAGCRYLCFGDDVESDARIFTLFGEVCAGLGGSALDATLHKLGVAAPEREAVVELARHVPRGDDPVEHVLIRMEKLRDPSRLDQAKVTGIRTFLQAALWCAHRGFLAPPVVTAVADHMRAQHVPEERLAASVADARLRLGIPEELLALAVRR